MRLLLRSRPSRARGLKQVRLLCGVLIRLVAPLTGAWIETIAVLPVPTRAEVAPLTGAWIETPEALERITEQARSRPSRARGLKQQRPCPASSWRRSRPSRARGLKLPQAPLPCWPPRVAPLTGAWIETRAGVMYREVSVESRPSRARGLKLWPNHGQKSLSRVAPLTGAWIETGQCLYIHTPFFSSRPSRARGLKQA